MTERIATAAWADPDEVEERYPYRDGTVWLGRSGSEGRMPLGYLDDRHVCLVGGSRGGKGTTSIIPALVTWPGSLCVVDPKGENATITAARRGGGSTHCKGMGQTVKVLDPFQSAQVADDLCAGASTRSTLWTPRPRKPSTKRGASPTPLSSSMRAAPTIRSGMNRRGRWSRGCSFTS